MIDIPVLLIYHHILNLYIGFFIIYIFDFGYKNLFVGVIKREVGKLQKMFLRFI